jgi:ribonuclease-3
VSAEAGAAEPDAALTRREALASRLGFTGDPVLLRRALTHPSFAHEHPPAADNEILAFLGDAVLGLAVADLLVRVAPEGGPGSLTARRAEIVSNRALAALAREVGVGPCLELGRGEAQHGGREKDSVLASALEAVVAALYLGGGLPAVWPLARRLTSAEGATATETRAGGAPGAVVG